MAKGSLIEQLDRAVGEILAHPDLPLPRVGARVLAQLRVAAELRGLPRPDFKARLKSALAERASMKTAVKPVREGFHTVTPYLVTRSAGELIDFVKQAFGGAELLRTTGSAGGIHAELKIEDSIIMIGGGEDWRGSSMPTGIHLYVKDADAVYERAVQAGGTSMYAPVDQFYGDREAGVKDLAGNHWYIATHKATGHLPEGLRTVTPFLHPRGAAQMIEFLQSAFGAEEQFRAQSPEGVIQHASIMIGDSIIEMGEAHDAWQPMASTFFVYVDDVDSSYQRAVNAGAISQAEPADQPDGDRVAGVADPFDNVWYLATHIKEESFTDRAFQSDSPRPRQGEHPMSSKMKAIPEQQILTPNLAVKNAAAAIEFYEKVFGATVAMRLMHPDGRVGHAEIQIGQARIMLADEFPEVDHLGPQSRGGSTVGLHLMVEDVDAVVKRAVDEGATLLSPVKDEFYGHRTGKLSDPFGHVWYVGTVKEELSDEEVVRRYEEMMKG